MAPDNPLRILGDFMKYLFLVLLSLISGCSNSSPSNVEGVPMAAYSVTHELDDLCSDIKFPYQVVFFDGASAGIFHCQRVYLNGAANCVGVHVRIRRDYVVFGSAMVFATKRQGCPMKGKK